MSHADIRLIQHFDASALGLVRRNLFTVVPHPLITRWWRHCEHNDWAGLAVRWDATRCTLSLNHPALI
jgi:hypothetical protein